MTIRIIHVLIGLLLFGVILYQLQQHQSSAWWTAFWQSPWQWWAIVVALLLMPVNYLLEGLRWRAALGAKVPITIAQAWQGSFYGAIAGLLTPGRSGDYLGRLLVIDEDRRKTAIILSIHSALAQAANIAVLTCLALFVGPIQLEFYYWAAPMSLFLVLLLWQGLPLAKALLRPWRATHNYLHALRADYLPSAPQKVGLVLLAMSRYLVYSTQFILLLHAFGTSLELPASMVAITQIFWAQWIIPSAALLDVGVRGNLSLFFLHDGLGSAWSILAASVCLWLVNLVLPALLAYAWSFSRHGAKK